MLPRLLLPAALFLLRCLRGHGSETLPAPVNVRFLAKTFVHLLHWEPGAGLDPAGPLLYDVQYQRYGNGTWNAAPNCTRIPGPPCDLSLQTLQPKGHYLARVRAVTGERASNWTQTARFVPQEATLHLANLSLSVWGNTIRVSVLPPMGQGVNLSVEDLYPWWWQYHAHVRMPANNSQWIYIGTSLEFEINSLQWGERYCVQVKLQVASWPLPAMPTEEQCISTPVLHEEEEHAVASLHVSLLSLGALGALAFGIGLAWAYVKKPMKTPVMLTSLLNRHSHEGPRNERLPRPPGLKEVVLRLERDPIHPLHSLHLENHPLCTGRGRHEEMEALPTQLEKGCWLPGQAAKGLGLQRTILDTSSGSIDSGVCVQDPTDHLGLFLGSRELSLGSHKETSSFRGNAGGLWVEEQLLPVAPEPEERILPQICPSRYSGQEASEVEGCLTLASVLGGADCSEVTLATGYLKQASLDTPSAHRTTAPTKNSMDATNSCTSLDLRGWTLPFPTVSVASDSS